jgi:hypothetical protein
MAAIEIATHISTTTESDDNRNNRKKKNQNGDDSIKVSSLTMTHCRVIDNAGAGVRIRGQVKHNQFEEEKYSNYFDNNKGGNLVAAGDDDCNDNTNSNNEENLNSTMISQRRDPSGSSFRKGDWWCPRCNNPKQVVPASQSACPRCQRGERSHGKLLSRDEIVSLNQGLPSSSIIKDVVKNNEEKNGTKEVRTSSSHTTKGEEEPRWWYDGDDAGWIPYDIDSTTKLERAYRSLFHGSSNHHDDDDDDDDDGDGDVSPLDEEVRPSCATVSLLEGKYRVNLQTMEQVNTGTHFLRFVRRTSGPGGGRNNDAPRN